MPAKKPLHHHLDRKLLIRLVIYIAIFLFMLGVVLFDMYSGQISIGLMMITSLLGVVIGLLLTRTSRLTYDKEVKKVISRTDIFGAVILGIYIAFSLYRRTFVGYFVHGPSLAAASLSLAMGVMAGRIIGLRRAVKQVLTEHNVPH